jgi:ribose-phosphate pyrophosphokinase
MNLTLFTGSANPSLAETVAARLRLPLGRCALHRFPDGELHVELQETVRGHDVYLLQSTGPPVETHLLELLLLADACRRAGAAHLTALVPYFGYARQDRRASGREAVGARLVADLLGASGLERVVAVDLHSPALEGFFPVPLEHLSAVPLLAQAAAHWVRPNSVIVAPDLGAAKLADRYARALQLPVAIVQKTRLSGEEVSVHGVTGEVQGCAPVVVDDMISTGGTMAAAIQAVRAAGALPEVTALASHALLVGPAVARLRAAPVERLLTTDSVVPAEGPLLPLEMVSLGPLLAEAIERLHAHRSLDDLIVHE